MTLAKADQPILRTTSAQLAIDFDGGIRSSRFNDIYFIAGRGAEESRYVFLEGNNLAERWTTLFAPQQQQHQLPHPPQHFIIGETGFGTGLNFLTAVDLWLSTAKRQNIDTTQIPTLYYYATERFPLTPTALNKVYAAYNPFPNLALQLQKHYPDPISSDYFLEFDFAGYKVKLILLFGDSCDALKRLESYPQSNTKNINFNPNLIVDAWFLDGFAPPVNPEMWSQELFKLIESHSDLHTSLATFTVARPVKDLLAQHNFCIEKRPGFGKKREMLTAQYTPSLNRADQPSVPEKSRHFKSNDNTLSPCYFRYPTPTSKVNTSKQALIIGAGIAGACTAWQLAQAGWNVTVVDSNNALAQGASGNSVGVLYARTASQRSILSDFHESSFHYAVNFYRSFNHSTLSSGLSGMLQLGAQLDESFTQNNPELSSRKNVTQQQASTLSGLELNSGGIFYTDAGWISPTDICTKLLNAKNIQFLSNTTIESFNKANGQWLAKLSNNTTLTADAVVIACGEKSSHFAQSQWLPLKALRGQTTELHAKHQPKLTELLSSLKIAVCAKGYITPLNNGVHSVGASFSLNNSSANIQEEDHYSNLSKFLSSINENTELSKELTLLANDPSKLKSLAGRVGFRAVSTDYLPIVGPLSQPQQFETQFASLRKDAKQTAQQLASLEDGLFVIAGFGAHGFTTAPLSASLLAAQITQMPIPFGDKLRQAISPNRFLVRQLIRGK